MEKRIYDQVLQFETHMHKHTGDQYLTISHRSVWVKVQTSNTMRDRGNYDPSNFSRSLLASNYGHKQFMFQIIPKMQFSKFLIMFKDVFKGFL